METTAGEAQGRTTREGGIGRNRDVLSKAGVWDGMSQA